jgi:hypothetical protein
VRERKSSSINQECVCNEAEREREREREREKSPPQNKRKEIAEGKVRR